MSGWISRRTPFGASTADPLGRVYSWLSVAMLIGLCSVVSAAPAPLPAGAPAAQVIITAGRVQAVAPDGTARTLRRRDQVFVGDTLTTGPVGRTQIRFTDGALVSIRSGTELAIDQYRYENRDASDVKELRLNRGGFRTVTGRIGRTNRSAYRVTTPVAVIGIRGTDWEALQQANGPLLLAVNAGAVSAETSTGSVAELGEGANFNYAQVNLDGSIDLLTSVPEALAVTANVEEAGLDDEQDAADDDGETVEVAAEDAAAAPESTETSSTSGGGGGGGGGQSLVDAGAPAVSVNPSETGTGVVATKDPLTVVFTTEEVAALTSGQQLAVGVGLDIFSGESSPRNFLRGAASGIAASDLDSFDLAFNTNALTVAGTDRNAVLNTGSRLLLRSSSTPVSNRVDNAGGITGLTFGRFNASAAMPMPVFFNQTDATSLVQLTSPVTFAIATPANVANLSGRFIYTPSATRLVSASTGTVSTVAGDILLNMNLNSGLIERGSLDVGFGNAANDFVFVANFTGSVAGAVLNANVTSVVLVDRAMQSTLPARGTLAGVLTGTSAVPSLVVAFDYVDIAGRNQFARGVVLFNGAVAPVAPTRALSATELSLLQNNFMFIGGDARPDGGLGFGRAIDARVTAGSPLFALNGFIDPQSGQFETFDTGDPGFLDLPPDIIIRQDNAPLQGFQTTFTIPGTQSLSWGRWQGSPGAPVRAFDAITGLPSFEDFDVPIYWATLLPRDIASLTGFAQFSGTSAGSTPTLQFQGAYGASNGQLLPIQRVDTSFFIDFATGRLSSGQLFVTTEFDANGARGFDLQFDGQVLASTGLGIVQFNQASGSYRGNLPLLDASLEGAFIGSGATTAFAMGFFAESQLGTGASEFVIGDLVLGPQVEQRIGAAEAAGLNRLGVAVFAPTAGFASHRPGVLLGVSNTVSSDATDTFLLTGTSATSVFAPNLSVGPAASVLRQGSALPVSVADSVGNLPTGFEIGWGVWQMDPQVSGPSGAIVQNSAANAQQQVQVNTDVLFASLTPAPAGLTGTATYSGSSDGQLGPLDFLATGGDIGGSSVAFDTAAMTVNVDFNSGAVSGNLDIGSSQQAIGFNTDFAGQLNRNMANMTLSNLQVFIDSSTGVAGDIANSSMIGVVTGPSGNSFFGGFQLQGAGQHVEGLIVAGQN